MNKMKPIFSKNTDYYQWGKNCAILNFSPKRAEKIVNHSDTNKLVTIEDQDMFFEGYYYGLEKHV